jgi:hypothetical protein
MRWMVFVVTASSVAGAAVGSLAACKNGEYDGSYDGSFDAGSSTTDGSTTTHVVQPDKTETFASSDGVFDVTFGAGTFAGPATVTITSAGEQTLDTGLIVPIYVVASDKPAAKFFQVGFRGSGNPNGNQIDRVLVPAEQLAGTFKSLAIAGTQNSGGSNGTFWGLTKTFGTFSLVTVANVQGAGFADIATSCTGQCCGTTNGAGVSGVAGGCFCSSGPNLACFLEHCADLDAPAARCSAIGAANSVGSVDCRPFGAVNCPGPGCPSYQGMCGNGGGGGTNNLNVCCVINKNSGSCVMGAACRGYAARCTANTACPLGTSCCVFENESYCASDCPARQRACASNADCADAGADGGTCRGGGCPVAVCGTPPGLCQ